VRSLCPSRGGRTPAVALTAFARSEDRTRAVMAGYPLHVPKPVEPQELVVTVKCLIANAIRGVSGERAGAGSEGAKARVVRGTLGGHDADARRDLLSRRRCRHHRGRRFGMRFTQERGIVRAPIVDRRRGHVRP
jgi:CheY-like chemotaxis protein